MNRDEFDLFVRRLEEVSQRQPRLFLARIVGYVALAYGYLGVVLLGSLALCGATIALIIYLPNAATIKLGLFGIIVFGGIFWAVLRGLWVRLEPPEGQAVTREQAPKLFAMLDELRAALDCQPFHKVLLMADHNAAVVQIPRLGVFGWHRNYLLLGLPLMLSLAPDEFKAVLAHEFAHSSRGHGRFSNWLYRVRRSWDRIFEQMAKQGSRGGFVLRGFIKWWWPHYNGHAFVLARANEYEADACSVRLAGADAAARALTRLPVADAIIEENFWRAVNEKTKTEKEPPAIIMFMQAEALKSSPSAEDAARWMRQAFLRETNNADTHPCLKDRLRAIDRLPAGVERGEFPPPPPPPAQTAAEVFLGPHGEVAARQMSEEWRKAVATQWSEQHERAAKLSAELASIETPAGTPATAEALWTKALKVIELNGYATAAPVLDQVLALNPKHAGANFIHGRELLEKDDPRGIEFIETAIATDPTATEDACNLLYAHYTRTGQRDKLRPLENRVDAFQTEAALAQQERAVISTADVFLPSELTPEQIAELRKIFATEAEVLTAAVARKQVQHFPANPCFVIALRLHTSFLKYRSTEANTATAQRLVDQMTLPGYMFVFVAEQNMKALGNKIFAVPTAAIYDRAATQPPPLP